MNDMFSVIPLQTTYGELAQAAHAFLSFLKEVPEAEKRRVHFDSKFHRGSADGYCDVRKEPGKDPKEYFHWAPRLRNRSVVREVASQHDAATTFFDAAEHVHSVSERMAETVFAKDYPQFYDRCFDAKGKLFESQLRFLCYEPRPVAFRAAGHYDKGYGSIALAESSAGLRVGCCKKHPLTEVRHNDGTAVFMPGQLMWEDSNRRIIPAWHDVIPDPTVPNVSERCARWAIILFISDKDGRYPSHKATHTPLPVHERLAA